MARTFYAKRGAALRVLLILVLGQPPRFDARFEGNNVSLDELGFILSNTFLRDFSKKDKLITINPFSVPSVSPAIAQAPTQLNSPNFLSLVMLSVGGIALLGWLRAKRQKQQASYSFY